MWVKEKNKRLYELCKGFPPRDAEETHMGFPRLAEGVSALAGQTGCPTLRSAYLVSYG